MPARSQNSKVSKNNTESVCYIYCRVSSKAQNNIAQGHTSLEVQREKCVEKARELGYADDDIQIFEEVMSARNMDKMLEFNRMMRKIGHSDMVLFYSTNRFSRNIMQALSMLHKITQKKAKYLFVTENLGSNSTAAQRLSLHTLLASAEYESGLLGERVKSSIAKRRQMGSHIGKVPYGYRHHRLPSGKLILEKKDEEQKVLELIDDLMASKTFDTTDMVDALNEIDSQATTDVVPTKESTIYKYSTIADELNERGYTMRGCKPWTGSSVRYHYNKYISNK